MPDIFGNAHAQKFRYFQFLLYLTYIGYMIETKCMNFQKVIN